MTCLRRVGWGAPNVRTAALAAAGLTIGVMLSACSTQPPQPAAQRSEPLESAPASNADPRPGDPSAMRDLADSATRERRPDGHAPAQADPPEQQRWAMRQQQDDQRAAELPRPQQAMPSTPPPPAPPAAGHAPRSEKPAEPPSAPSGPGSPPGARPATGTPMSKDQPAADPGRGGGEAAAYAGDQKDKLLKEVEHAAVTRRAAMPLDTEVWVVQRSAPAKGRALDAIAGAAVLNAGKRGLTALRTDADGRSATAPLATTSTIVMAHVTGASASVTVRQKFVNSLPESVGAIYTFSLPHDAAVCDFVVTIGKRQIRAVVREREEAAAIYADAVRQGHPALLLSADSENSFTQLIGNIEAGGEVDVSITYLQTVPFIAGSFELSLPPPVGGDLATPGSFRVSIEGGPAISAVESPSHTIVAVRDVAGRRWNVSLDGAPTSPDAEVIVRWRPVGKGVRVVGAAGRGHDGGRYFNLAVLPPDDADLPAALPLDLVFVTDPSTSNGTSGARIARAVCNAAENLLSPSDALARVDLPAAAGPATLARLLAETAASGRRRHIVLLTDGRSGGSIETIQALRQAQVANSLSVIAIGPSPDWAVCAALARAGRGVLAAAANDADSVPASWSLLTSVGRAAMTDVRVEVIGGGDVEVLPSATPDVLAGRPVYLSGRVAGGGEQDAVQVRISGRIAGEKTSIDLTLRLAAGSPDDAARLWARRAVADACLHLPFAVDRAGATRAKDLALRFGVVSAYTALIAVDAAR